MSNQLLSVGASGMIAMSKGMSVVGNNIANSRTIGFKRSKTTFADSFYSQGIKAANAVIQNQRGFGTTAVATNTDWQNGVLDETGVSTHFAIIGDGFVPVEFNGAVLYSRAADFSFVESATTAGEYELVRPNGAILLDKTATLTTGIIRFSAIPSDFKIGRDGALTATGATQSNGSTIGIQQFGNPDALERKESGLYNASASVVKTTATPTTPGTNSAGYLLQGNVEQANVDLVSEFTDMIALQRAFQANSKTITTADSMLQDVIALKR